MEQFIATETLVIGLMLIVSLVAIAVRRLRIPYTVALVIAGLVLTIIRPTSVLSLTPELIMALLVPPLLFEAAFHIKFSDIQRNLPTILLLTIPGVILVTLVVGSLTALLTPLSLSLALVFGALIAATDPVSVVALFKVLGVPKRLAVLVESESLFNDGTAIVIFELAVAAAVSGHFDLAEGVVAFVRVAAGGIVVGFVLGWLISRLIGQVDNYLIETTLTTVLAYGAYLIAEQLHVSGVLAVVVAGLVNGNLGPQGMSPTTRIVLFNFWEYLAFLVNSFVFLLIGMEVNISTLIGSWRPILWAILAVLAARSLTTYSLTWLGNRVSEPIPLPWQHVLNWGGLRGAISLALALSLPIALGPERNTVQTMAFGVVLFTLLVQGTTMKPLLKWLRVVIRDPVQVEYETHHARLMAFRAGATHLEKMYHDGFLSESTWESLRPHLRARAANLTKAIHSLLSAHPALAAEELENARRELLRAQRAALLGLLRDGIVSEEVFNKLVAEIDVSLTERPRPVPPLAPAAPPAEKVTAD